MIGQRRVGAWVLFVGIALSLPIAYSVHAAVPPNPVRLPYEQDVHARQWAPQGWAFFTRDPREPVVLSFRRTGDGVWRSASLGEHTQPRFAFGLNRRWRVQGVEMGLLLAALRQRSNVWSECGDELARCLEAALPAATIVNVSPEPTLCGAVGLARREIVPWAWSHAQDALTMPSQVVRLVVSCSGS